jgi:hypothetical protein
MPRHPTPAALRAIRDIVAEAEACANPEWRRALAGAAAQTLVSTIEAVATGQPLPLTQPVTDEEVYSINTRVKPPHA